MMDDVVRKKQSARRREQLEVFLDSSTALSVRTDWLLALPRCQRHGYGKVNEVEANWRVLSQMLLCTKNYLLLTTKPSTSSSSSPPSSSSTPSSSTPPP